MTYLRWWLISSLLLLVWFLLIGRKREREGRDETKERDW